MIRYLLYGELMLHLPIGVYLLVITVQHWRAVSGDQDLVLTAWPVRTAAAAAARTYAWGNLWLARLRLIVALVFFVLGIGLALALFRGLVIQPQLALFSRVMILVLTTLQALIMHIERSTRLRILKTISQMERDES